MQYMPYLTHVVLERIGISIHVIACLPTCMMELPGGFTKILMKCIKTITENFTKSWK